MGPPTCNNGTLRVSVRAPGEGHRIRSTAACAEARASRSSTVEEGGRPSRRDGPMPGVPPVRRPGPDPHCPTTWRRARTGPQRSRRTRSRGRHRRSGLGLAYCTLRPSPREMPPMGFPSNACGAPRASAGRCPRGEIDVAEPEIARDTVCAQGLGTGGGAPEARPSRCTMTRCADCGRSRQGAGDGGSGSISMCRSGWKAADKIRQPQAAKQEVGKHSVRQQSAANNRRPTQAGNVGQPS